MLLRITQISEFDSAARCPRLADGTRVVAFERFLSFPVPSDRAAVSGRLYELMLMSRWILDYSK
jgi:hypothetical protein